MRINQSTEYDLWGKVVGARAGLTPSRRDGPNPLTPFPVREGELFFLLAHICCHIGLFLLRLGASGWWGVDEILPLRSE